MGCRVYCEQCHEKKDEDTTTFVNIAEDFQGYDELTFVCPDCHTEQTSRRYGR
jgi:5-methylcytosine-specific restriction endonuclease McrA